VSSLYNVPNSVLRYLNLPRREHSKIGCPLYEELEKPKFPNKSCLKRSLLLLHRLRGGANEVCDSDDSSDTDRFTWLKDLGPFDFPQRPRIDPSAVRVSAIQDIFYIPDWVSASEEAEIIRRSDAAPSSAWVIEAGRRFQVHKNSQPILTIF
jgi:hypothetical protein